MAVTGYFNCFNFETNFSEIYFLVESGKIENATFPYETALSEVNFKTNSMGNTKNEEWSLPVTTSLFFYKMYIYIYICIIRTSYKMLI